MTDPKPIIKISTLPVFVPILTQQKFSESTGIEIGVIEGWIKRGYIDTVKIGKRRLINIAALTNELLL